MTTNSTAPVGGADGARPDICTSPLCQLAKLASFEAGYHIKPTQKDSHGNVLLVQRQDFASGMQADKLQRARLTKPAPARILRAGDVLVHAQGVGYALALWDAPVSDALCVAPLIRIRPHDPAAARLRQALAYNHEQTLQALAQGNGGGFDDIVSPGQSKFN